MAIMATSDRGAEWSPSHHGMNTGQGTTLPEKNVAEPPGDTDR